MRRPSSLPVLVVALAASSSVLAPEAGAQAPGGRARQPQQPAAQAAAESPTGSGQETSQKTGQKTSFSDLVAGARHMPGFFDVYWREDEGKLYLAIGADRLDRELLYIVSLPAGVGSNDIGLDRGQLGDTRVVELRRVGPKVLLVQPNQRYRALSDNPAEARAVAEAFAESVVWGFEVAAELGDRILLDATPFLLRDAHRVVERLKQSRQGTYKIDLSRSAPYLDRTRSFPKNTELEATLTFTGEPEGFFIRTVAPSPDSVTVRQHHSFVELPDAGYRPREYDPRSGYISTTYFDYATPISSPIEKKLILRHRLEKRDPRAAVSEPVEPIVYYLDPGAPEPIRSALLEGARWWVEAFEAAGFRDAFRVELLPEGADPMDIRYNLIQWVHRSTRGWSYGSSVEDPRTGEILKGHVTLGSLRVRQDFLIAEALLAPYEREGEVPPEMEQMALARLRQLSAHEVGHTLGLVHNYAASVNDRASVMDYPHPFATLRPDGTVDLDGAYGSGLGPWDVRAIVWGYSQFPPGAGEETELDRILSETIDQGLLFLTDEDARPPGSAHPLAHLWDNGNDAAAELERVLDVRAAALRRFSERNIPFGRPLALLEDTLVPLYLFHRYQIEAAAKVLGGQDYRFAVRGDGQVPTAAVPAAAQRRALEALLRTLDASTLTLTPEILRLLPPRPDGFPRGRESFPSRTGVTFDPLAAADVAATMTLSLLFHPERASRLVDLHARDAGQPGLLEVIDAVVERTWKSAPSSGAPGLAAEVERVVDQAALRSLLALARSDDALQQARNLALLRLGDLERWLDDTAGDSSDLPPEELAHRRGALRQVRAFLEHPEDPPSPAPPLRVPDGPPIGMGEAGWLGDACAGSW
jgi:hypothetical protein